MWAKLSDAILNHSICFFLSYNQVGVVSCRCTSNLGSRHDESK